MLLPSKLNPAIKEIIEGDSLFDDFAVHAHSGDGDWIALLDMKEWIHICLTVKGDRVYAKASVNILGFSGVLESHEWCMPNNMLYRSIMQLLTIVEFLPRTENINDHEYRVHSRWIKERRSQRVKTLGEIRKQLQKDLYCYEDLLCLVLKYNLNPKKEIILWSDREKYVEKATRIVYNERRAQSEEN